MVQPIIFLHKQRVEHRCPHGDKFRSLDVLPVLLACDGETEEEEEGNEDDLKPENKKLTRLDLRDDNSWHWLSSSLFLVS